MKNSVTLVLVALLAGAGCGGKGPVTPGASTTTTTPAGPTIAGINPNTGTAAGGTAVTVTGTNFSAGATASIGGVALTGVSVAPTTLAGTTGATATAGPATVTVNSGGQSATLQNGFTYRAVARAVISGAPSSVDHDTDVTFSGMNSSTTAPYTIASYQWDCGQGTEFYGPTCLQTGITPTFKYRRCGVANRPPCTGTNQRTYTVMLTVTDTQGNQNTATFNITVRNSY